MALSNILTTNNTQDQSSDFTLNAGDTCTLFLKDAAGPALPDGALVEIQFKSADGEYYRIGGLTKENPAWAINTPGTYRVYRSAQTASVGVDKA